MSKVYASLIVGCSLFIASMLIYTVCTAHWLPHVFGVVGLWCMPFILCAIMGWLTIACFNTWFEDEV